jgi:hypothetical protein
VPTYEVQINGQTFEIDAPDDASVNLAVRQLQESTPQASASPEFAGGMSGAAALGAADTASFGFGDELGAGLGAASEYLASFIPGQPEGRSYDQILGAMRDQDARAKAANPSSYLAGQIAAGVGSGVGMAAGGLSLTANAGRAALAAGARPALSGMVARGAADGAIAGGIYGAGSGQGGSDRATQAAIGAGIGGAAGAAFPLATTGISAGYRNIADKMTGNAAARQAGVSPEAMRAILPTIEADGSLGAVGQRNMALAGQEAMIADAGPNARAVLDTAIQRGGAGGNLARGRIDERVARDSAALTQSLDNTLGAPEGVTAARTAIREQARPGLGAAYDAAYATPIDYAAPAGQQLEEMVRSRVPGSVISQANRLMQLEGQQSRQILANVADDGTVTFERLPDVRQLDYITRALNQAAETGEGAGALGGQTTLGRAYQGLSRDIRQSVRGLVPEYANALDTAADPIRRSQAVELGSRLLSPSLRRDQLAEAVQGYSAAERDALAQGVRSHIDDTIANVTRTVQEGGTDAREAYKAIRDLSSRASRDKLTTALGQTRAEPLFNELDRIGQSFNLRGSVAENSKTFARQATAQSIDNSTGPGAVSTLAQAKPLNAVQRVAQALTGQTPERLQGRQNAIYSEIADLLTRPAAQAIPAFQTMTNLSGRQAANLANANRIADVLTQIQASSGPTTALLANRPQR